ncbi:hypothetical protein OPQ81_009434 [Rhizoctonia solani]|nr:hypothetical protein OPQ81_009434 [Rhizoctonia solani]
MCVTSPTQNGTRIQIWPHKIPNMQHCERIHHKEDIKQSPHLGGVYVLYELEELQGNDIYKGSASEA